MKFKSPLIVWILAPRRGEGRRGFEKSVSRNFYCGRLKTILKEDIKFSCSLSLSLSPVYIWVRVYALCLHNTHKGAIELIHRTIPSTDACNSFVIFVDYESIYAGWWFIWKLFSRWCTFVARCLFDSSRLINRIPYSYKFWKMSTIYICLKW